MSISYVDINEELRRIVIDGRLDIGGTNSVASQLVELAQASKKGVVLDLTSLQLLASIGVRAIIVSAKAVKEHGGKMALVVDESSTVNVSLKATGVDQLVPIFGDADDAERAFAA